MNNSSNIVEDTLFNGDLICLQNRKGYRFSIDSVLLANFSMHWKNAKILDMGCGCGILSLLLLYRNSCNIVSITGVELQHSLEKLARMNCIKNGFSEIFTIIHGDYCHIQQFFPAEQFSHIICNPPFYKIGRGRKSTNNEEFLAKHQSAATLPQIINCVAYSLKNRGQFSIIYPAEALSELLCNLEQKNIQPKKLRSIYSYPESEVANLVLLECKKNGGVGMKILSPLYIYTEKNGNYTKEVENMYRF